MDFDFTKEQKMLQDSVKEYMKKEIVPIADEYDKKGSMSKKDAHKFLKGLIPFGYLGTMVSEQDGGPGLSGVEWGIIFFELRKAWASLGGITGITSSMASSIARCKNEDIKKKFLQPMLNADIIGCTGITEPNVGSDPSAIETLAVLDGDSYVLNGTKVFISNGTIADFMIVICLIQNSKDDISIGQLLVERDVSPYKATEIPKLGVKAFPTSEIVFEDCRVPKENLLSMPDKGFSDIMKFLSFARCNAAIAATGIADAAFDAAVEHAKQRVQFGKPIGKFQLIQEMIADMAIEIDAAKLLTFRAFNMLDKGKDIRKESSMAKAYATEMAIRVTSKAIQVHGSYGITEEYPLERYFRDARVFTFLDGTTQIQQLIIGREILSMSALR